MRDPGRGRDQLGSDGAGAGPAMAAAGEGAGGAGEVVGDGGAGQPGRVRGDSTRGQEGERAVLQFGDDLLNNGVAAVGGLGGQRRLGGCR